ncbi:methanol/ethanol family PQQ-dependent dehydrogenase [Roseomonas marmotae]|uniref:PQQ-dependent dehydrogenase, methanol/ethanol family n=1 Tax=Roseomonas marmotae TaxID=2768161 RepID=A0ABS3KD93_9PROT|nr:methanol/ethanol family PQQ-dependent dehydrogenase [Roseomonas marmotae]MBO1075446.1 PQQ-dependent dehydrogenase, methanol/ethanol family [Roseomonas marmotae]QTI81398.1 PQQ-dependent dehydrogenase, methanol/ethanol family [Roseomonas marmotae]
MRKQFRTALLGAVAGITLSAGAWAQQSQGGATPVTPVPAPSERSGTQQARPARPYNPVTDQRLQSPEPRNWLMYRRTYDGQGFSPLDQINAGNVQDLVPVWTYSTGVLEGHQSPPIVNDGIMFITTPQAQVIALDVKTGDQIWNYKRQLPEDLTQLHPTNRGVALYGDRVYLATVDAYLVALDAKTGTEIWAKKVEDYQKGHYMTLAPLVARGKVMVGGSGGEFGVRGYIAAFDAGTGEEAWRTYTVPGPGEPGHDTWQSGWETGGAPVWLTGHYDPQLNLAYWGTGNAAPWMGDARPGDNLHTSSVLALNPDDGKIRAHHQYHWNDSWDWDEVSAPILMDVERGGRTIPALVHPARNGYLWTLERAPDRIGFLSGVPFVQQDVFASLDPKTGRPTYNQARKPRLEQRVEFCPSLWGGKDWPPAAYSPQTRLVYIPANENLCGSLSGHRMDYVPGQLFLGAGIEDIGMSLRPNAPHIGELQAWDMATNRKVWSHPFPNSQLWGPVLATGGGLVFTGGTNDRMFRAFDAKTGQQLWQIRTNSGVTGVPTSFEVDGTQYIAVQSGWGVDAQRMQEKLFEIDPVRFRRDVPQGGVVWVFALKQRAQQ